MSTDGATRDPTAIPIGRLLGALLRDLARAQHLSNLYSTEALVPQYQADPLLQQFPVPNCYIDELELSFTVGIVGVTEPSAAPEMVRAGALAASTAMVRALGKAILDRLSKLLDDTQVKGNTEKENPLRKQSTYENACVYIEGRIEEYVRARVAEPGGPASEARDGKTRVEVGREDRKRLVEEIVKILKPLLPPPSDAKLVRAIEKTIQSVVAEQLGKWPNEVQRRTRRHMRSLLVSTGPSAPGASTGTIRLKTSMREHKWTASLRGGDEAPEETSGTLYQIG